MATVRFPPPLGFPTHSIHIDRKIFTLKCDKSTNNQSIMITEQGKSSIQTAFIFQLPVPRSLQPQIF
uniref:Uncharacterized protein n=1 Tax=Cucumis melo TaxID=3656 RepID=A0A9I9E4V6_CUCME